MLVVQVKSGRGEHSSGDSGHFQQPSSHRRHYKKVFQQSLCVLSFFPIHVTEVVYILYNTATKKQSDTEYMYTSHMKALINFLPNTTVI